jgi:hypothetical protein
MREEMRRYRGFFFGLEGELVYVLFEFCVFDAGNVGLGGASM